MTGNWTKGGFIHMFRFPRHPVIPKLRCFGVFWVGFLKRSKSRTSGHVGGPGCLGFCLFPSPTFSCVKGAQSPPPNDSECLGACPCFGGYLMALMKVTFLHPTSCLAKIRIQNLSQHESWKIIYESIIVFTHQRVVFCVFGNLNSRYHDFTFTKSRINTCWGPQCRLSKLG